MLLDSGPGSDFKSIAYKGTSVTASAEGGVTEPTPMLVFHWIPKCITSLLVSLACERFVVDALVT